ncbi:hypothetical protein NDA13_001170 [Ustilago tritici]|nr:hypothetical protein NDA13_001170 [Ustilago tritici]
MRLTPALALLASFLAASAVGVVASHHHGGHGYGHGHANAHIRPRSRQLHQKRDGGDATTPAPQPLFASAGPGDDSGVKKDKKKGKCSLKKQKQKDQGQEAADQGLQGSGGPPVTGVPSLGGEGDGTQTPVTGVPSLGGEGDGAQPLTDGSSSAAPQPSRDSVPADYSTGGQSGGDGSSDTGAGANRGSNPGGSPSADDNAGFPGQTGTDGSQGQNPESYGAPPSGYASTPTPNTPHITPSTGAVTGNQVKCKGLRGSTFLSSTGTFKPHQFSPELIYHGPGTTFGRGPNFWQGGACMFDDLPHANLPSVAMDQTFFQDGLACGTCVEIASTSVSLFSNDAVWTVETPKVGKLPPGKKTVAIVSELCPGVNQCWSGLDMHPDAWYSVTGQANGTKLPINWKFVNCKQAFQKSGSGGKNLQIHWRPGANAGYFQVQVRGSHEAVVRMEMKVSGKGWSVAKHVDNSWWKWDGNATSAVKDNTAVLFRVTDWQGQTITSEVGTVMGKDLLFEANFDRVGGGSQPEGYEA